MNTNSKDYDDIINIKYPFQLKHPRMGVLERAAQFSAFKALSGYDAEIEETARLTDIQADLDASAMEILDIKLRIIKEKIYNSDHPLVQIVYFIPDAKKAGGEYVSVSVRIKKIDDISKTIQTTTGLNILIKDIHELDGEIFSHLEL